MPTIRYTLGENLGKWGVGMTKERIVNSLSYLSILFLPVLFPVIVWAVTRDQPAMHKVAGQAFLWHILPVLAGLVFLAIVGVVYFFQGNGGHAGMAGGFAMIFMALTGLIAIGSYLWSLIQGIKYLVQG